MFSVKSFAWLALLAVSAVASPSDGRTVLEKRHDVSGEWARSGKAQHNRIIPLRFALAQSNLDKGDAWLMDVAHPSSLNYGKHWTLDQVRDAFQPSDETVKAVRDWISGSGIASNRIRLSKGRNWLHLDATIREAEALLDADYYSFTHQRTGQGQIACDSYSLPSDIIHHIDFITPTVHFDTSNSIFDRKKPKRDSSSTLKKRQDKNRSVPPHYGAGIGQRHRNRPHRGPRVYPKQQNMLTSNLTTCGQFITPDCLAALYNFEIGQYSNPDNSYGIVEYTPQSYRGADLDLFFSNFTPNLVGQRPTFDSIDGGVLVTSFADFSINGESDLDLEYAFALAQPQEITLYQVGDLVEGASFNNFLDALDASYCTFEGGDNSTFDAIYPDPLPGGYKDQDCGKYPPAKVISTSYSEVEPVLTVAYAQRQCNEYMKLGLMGTTFLYSSGDFGVAGNGSCIDNATGMFNDGNSGMFVPNFPSTCPYVLSIGATQLRNGTNLPKALRDGKEPEIASETVIFSGGGFSNIFSLPDYQASAVRSYFADNVVAYGPDRFNTSGKARGFPDVSANGVNYTIAIDGEFALVYGTSASAPTFGSVVTLINAARMNEGKSSVGFVNPAFYANPGAFNDITEGGNQGCGTPGFESAPGWDPVTGLGTPNFKKLLDVFMSLP